MSTTGSPPLSACFDLISALSRSTGEDDIFDAALAALDKCLRIRRAAFLLSDGNAELRFHAWRGLSASYRQAAERDSPWAACQAAAGPVVVPDVAADTALSRGLPALRAEGIAALVFLPLTSVGVSGALVLYFDEPHAAPPEDVQVAAVIGGQAILAVASLRARREAEETGERLSFALDAAQMGTWNWDIVAGRVEWSENLERLHGLAPGEFDGTLAGVERGICEEDREHVRMILNRAVSTGAPYQVEYRLAVPDGGLRWVQGKGRVLLDPSGQPVRMRGVCRDITARKLAEAAKLASIEQSTIVSGRLAAIVESSYDAIVSKDLNGVITSWNRAAERIFGYTADEAVGQSITLIVPPDRRGEEDLVLGRIRAGKGVEMETVRAAKDGRRLDIALTISPVRDASGQVVGASKIARDITARKRDEAELADLHARLERLVASSASLLGSTDVSRVCSVTLASAQQLLGADGYALWHRDGVSRSWHAVETIGLSESFSRRIVSAVDWDRHASSLAGPMAVEDLASHPLLEAQLEAHTREGVRSILACPMYASAVLSDSLVAYYRTPHHFSNAETEVAQTLANLASAALGAAGLYEQQRAQREGAERMARREAFLAGATGVLTRSLDYEQTLATVAQLAVPTVADWCAVHIVSPEGQLERLAVAHADPDKVDLLKELETRYPRDPYATGGFRDVRMGRSMLIAAMSPDQLTASAVDDEHLRLLRQLSSSSYIAVPLTTAESTIGVLTFAYAGSGRHYTTEELQIAESVAARAALAIDNARAYQRATEANRVKDEFLATLSHELRTPLNAILGYAQMLQLGLLKTDQRDHALSVVLRNSEMLRQIIDDVLDIARITAGKIRLKMQPLDLTEILSAAIATAQPAADAKGVTLHLVTEGPAPAVSGDSDRLQQVAWNLLSNAVKFTPSGGEVRVGLSGAASSAEISVSDTGHGIDADFLPYVFERFRQADSRFSREHGGLGIGLAIVREIVHLHGGTVTASSEGRGRGSLFRIQLPAVHALAAGPAEAMDRPRHLAGHTLAGVRVLAVDDEQDARDLVRAVLENVGASVTTAGSAPQALEALRGGAHDVLLIDVGMPNTNGLELIQMIRETLPERARTPAAALTAYAGEDDRVRALASGFQMHIPKPVSPAKLVRAVAALLGRAAPA